jgi:hypothetical protein
MDRQSSSEAFRSHTSFSRAPRARCIRRSTHRAKDATPPHRSQTRGTLRHRPDAVVPPKDAAPPAECRRVGATAATCAPSPVTCTGTVSHDWVASEDACNIYQLRAFYTACIAGSPAACTAFQNDTANALCTLCLTRPAGDPTLPKPTRRAVLRMRPAIAVPGPTSAAPAKTSRETSIASQESFAWHLDAARRSKGPSRRPRRSLPHRFIRGHALPRRSMRS